jgi:hypothetical protein
MLESRIGKAFPLLARLWEASALVARLEYRAGSVSTAVDGSLCGKIPL